MIVAACQHENCKKNGKDENGTQRYKCLDCGKRFREESYNVLGELRIDLPRAEMILKMLLEGTSVRSAARLTGTDPHTILRLLTYVGERCQGYLERRLKGLKVEHCQIDEVWQFIYCKERTAQLKGFGPDVGDSYLFTAIDRDSKLLIASHLGQRTNTDAGIFCRKLSIAIDGRFILSSDGFASYFPSVYDHLAGRVDYGQVIKQFGKSSVDQQRTYSPASIIGIKKQRIMGAPVVSEISTSICERQNLNFRTFNRRMARLTNGFSKKWENHQAQISLYIMHYNFVRVHGTTKKTPAVAHGLETRAWTMREMLTRIAA